MALKNWRYILRTLDWKEKIAIFLLVTISFAALVFWVGKIYLSLTEKIPQYGGNYVEGVIGQPMYVNPILSKTNEVDESLVGLIYSSLLKYGKDGKIINDLTESYIVSEDGKEYLFSIKRGVKWHDGEEIRSDDIIFTLNIIKDPLFKSPIRQNWQGVTTERVDDYNIKFILEKPYFGFLENLTFGILPEHIWNNISSEKFHLAKYNLEPIGSGPYRFSNFHKDSEGNILDYELKSFESYHSGVPYISAISFNFYKNEQAMIESYNRKEIDGISRLSPQNSNMSLIRKNSSLYELEIPWPFAIFFNKNKSISLADSKVREALVLSIDKKQIIDSVLAGKASEIDSPFFPGTDEYAGDVERLGFDLDRANKILEDGGWKIEEDGIREKDGNRLSFELYMVDSADLVEISEVMKEQWKKVGAEVKIVSLGFSDIQQNHIRPREYDALFIGQDASFNVDPYSFWHSSNKKDPGLNLALFEDSEADKLISEAREEVDKEKRIEKYKRFQEIISRDNPALFLLSPHYLYLVDRNIKGIELERINSSRYRFSNVDKWYIKTKRIFKK